MHKITDDLISSEDLIPTLEIQSEISLRELDASFLKWLKLFAPYGPHNMRPVFVSRNVEVVGDIQIVGNNHLKFKVKDSGIGVSEEDLTKIFNEFYRSENAKKVINFGTGLGLSLVKQLVEKYGGKIEVQSELQKGTDFIISFPITVEQ